MFRTDVPFIMKSHLSLYMQLFVHIMLKILQLCFKNKLSHLRIKMSSVCSVDKSV